MLLRIPYSVPNEITPKFESGFISKGVKVGVDIH